MMSDFRYEIKTSLPVIRLETLTQKKSGLVRTQRTNETDLGSSLRGRQVPLVEVDEVRVQRIRLPLNK
jgi:hypothetical protein